MDKDKISKFIEKISKDKKIGPLLIIVLILIFVCICLSYFSDVKSISNNGKKTGANVTINDNLEDNAVIDKNYEEEQKKNLEEILSHIDGVGNVKVELRFAGSDRKVPAKDKNTQESKTEETDSNGGKRVNSQLTSGDEIVMEDGEKGNTPFILETQKPSVSGVIVVAEGAQDAKIKYEITKAIANLYDISLEEVSVFSMKTES